MLLTGLIKFTWELLQAFLPSQRKTWGQDLRVAGAALPSSFTPSDSSTAGSIANPVV